MPRKRYLSITLICLSACTHQASQYDKQDTATGYLDSPPTNIDQILATAKSKGSREGQKILLGASQRLYEERRPDQALVLLESMHISSLPAAQRGDAIFLLASIYIDKHNIEQAENILTTNSLGLFDIVNQLPIADQIALSNLKATMYSLHGDFIASLRERVFYHAILPPEAQATNIEKIWADLLKVANENLERGHEETPFPSLQGWLELAYLYKTNEEDIDQQIKAIDNWLKRWPSHIAAIDLPQGLEKLRQLANEKPKKIAFILPAEGRYANAAMIIRSGFMTAYYKALQAGSEVPAVTFYSSQGAASFETLYNKASHSDAELVIGPLTKQNVSALSKIKSLPKPTLALNYLKADTPIPENIYQYSLAPEDEVQQIADTAWRNGHKTTVIIRPDSSWGQRVTAAFETYWRKLGGNVIDSMDYSKKTDYSEAIRKLLSIDKSEARYRDLRQETRLSLKFTPRKRNDIDFILLLGNPKEARQLKPTLDFFYASDLPIYSTSQIYTGNAIPSADRDLNGITFTDIPWNVTAKKPPADVKPGHRRLFAFGMDIFKLYPRVKMLETVKNGKIFGETGTLSIAEDNKIRRALSWGKFENGYVIEHEPRPSQAPESASGV